MMNHGGLKEEKLFGIGKHNYCFQLKNSWFEGGKEKEKEMKMGYLID